MIFDKPKVLTDMDSIAKVACAWEIPLSVSMSHMPAGHNGPYFDIETPIRNTAHWLTFFSILYNLTRNSEYKQIADRLFAYVKSPVFPRHGAAYTHRQKPGKDRCNGVIGAAWIIEALVRYSKYIKSNDAHNLALEIARSLPFDSTQCAWKRCDPNAGIIGIDPTYNHQAWFAAAVAELDPSMAHNVTLFLNRSAEGAFRTRNNGRINHLMYLHGIYNRAAQCKYSLQHITDRKTVSTKEDGYHLYVLFALARLKSIFPDHPFFSHAALKQSLQYIAAPEFLDKLSNSPYAYPYNAPGFELPIIVATFASYETTLQTVDCMHVYNEQRKRTFSEDIGLYIKESPDPCTLAARVYELAIGVEAIATILEE